VQDNIRAVIVASANRKAKRRANGVELAAKALTYLADTNYDISDGSSILTVMSDFDKIKAQLDEDFATMRTGFQQARGRIEKEVTNIHESLKVVHEDILIDNFRISICRRF